MTHWASPDKLTFLVDCKDSHQGLDQILDLAKSLPNDVPGRFVLVGERARRGHHLVERD